MPLYNNIGEKYDKSRHADPFITERLIKLLKVDPGREYIDIACGTGNYTMEILKTGAVITGVDESEIMIRAALNKNPAINWILGNAEKLPFETGKFHGAVCTLAIHHFRSLDNVFSEVFRILSTGNFIIFTSTKEQMKNFWLNEYFPEAMSVSIKQMPSLEQIINSLSKSGFTSILTEPYFIGDDLKDMFLYSGKHKPEMYLDPDIRSGISTFSVFASDIEIELGSKRLQDDINSGQINRVIDQYDDSPGDYVFISAVKKGSH